MTAITHNTWIAIADGAKALVLRNEGEADVPNFVKMEVFRNEDTEPTSVQGADKPGRTHESATARRSAVSQTDWHEIEEHRFAKTVAGILERHRQKGDFAKLVIVAPPRTLADLRREFSKPLQESVVAEIDKDLTNHPIYEIEKVLLAS